MSTKLRPGQTFSVTIDGDRYDLAVLSVGDRLDISDRFAALGESASQREHHKAWLDVVGQHLKGWSHDEPLDQLRYVITIETLNELVDALIRGNSPTVDELKN